ncbi:uncharacterized protein [Palaemon carinicauda]|uniref:uncharacterized protein isoform X1 n=1 Tax=Palaemon carinicauda TaxID=392227 RepID=UPI0035B5900A
MACSLKCVVGFGIFLAVLDILHGLATLGFYGYRFVAYSFYLCPRDLDITVCQNKLYIYEQLFTFRVYVGLGEGAITPFFVMIYIIALVKHMPWLTWFWLLKSFGIMGINVYYISYWVVRRKSFDHINYEPQDYENHFLYFGAGLTLAQLLIMLLFCLVGGIFSYKVCEENRRSRRSLHTAKFRKNGGPTAPPMDYDDQEAIVQTNVEDHQFLNQALADSTHKFPLPGSSGSIDKAGRAETLRHPSER